jgi:hypothetical protein
VIEKSTEEKGKMKRKDKEDRKRKLYYLEEKDGAVRH